MRYAEVIYPGKIAPCDSPTSKCKSGTLGMTRVIPRKSERNMTVLSILRLANNELSATVLSRLYFMREPFLRHSTSF